MKKGLFNILTIIAFSLTLLLTNIPSLNAASGTISVRSNKTTAIVGSTITVTVTTSSSVPLGSWQYTIKYDSSKLKLMSGQEAIANYGDGSKKSSTETYTFKILAKGSSTISVQAYGGYAYSEEVMSFNVSGVTVKGITQAELEASYSKNNNLSNLEITGYNLSPEFNKDTTEYSVTVPSDVEKITLTGAVEDKKASVNGLGEFDVSEGENKFDVTVTAENGSAKTYTVKINVEDENPIEVIIDSKKYTVVKRGSTLTAPSTYEATTQMINGIEVPAFKSNITGFVLVGLKATDGAAKLYIYDENTNTYTEYVELKTEGLLLFPKKAPSSPKYYKIKTITINEQEVEAYQYDGVDEYYLIYGVNIETGVEGFYQYDMVNNTITRYNDKIINELTKRNENYLMIIIVLGVETLVLLLILLLAFIKRNKKSKIKVKKVTFDDLEKELNEKPKKEEKSEQKNKKEQEKTKEENKIKIEEVKIEDINTSPKKDKKTKKNN